MFRLRRPRFLSRELPVNTVPNSQEDDCGKSDEQPSVNETILNSKPAAYQPIPPLRTPSPSAATILLNVLPGLSLPQLKGFVPSSPIKPSPIIDDANSNTNNNEKNESTSVQSDVDTASATSVSSSYYSFNEGISAIALPAPPSSARNVFASSANFAAEQFSRISPSSRRTFLSVTSTPSLNVDPLRQKLLSQLESDTYEDNVAGLKRLIQMVNSELVNIYSSRSTDLLSCQLIFGGVNGTEDTAETSIASRDANDDSSNGSNRSETSHQEREMDKFAHRLQLALLSFFRQEIPSNITTMGPSISNEIFSSGDMEEADNADSVSISSCQSADSSVSDDSTGSDLCTSLFSGMEDFNTSMGKHRGELQLPALRALVSALQVALASSSSKSALLTETCNFWKQLVLCLVSILQNSSNLLQVAFVCQCLRHLVRLHQKNGGSLLAKWMQYSMLPFIIHAKDVGQCNKNHMLQKEAQRLMNILTTTKS